MTNRQWIDTLTNAELMHWILDRHSSMKISDKDRKVYYDALYPRLQEVYALHSDAELRLLEWLDEEHIDYSDGINFEEIK